MAMPAAGVRRDHSSMCCVKHALRDLLGKYLYTALCFFLLEKNAMFTTESFCNLVWGTSYLKVLRKISKEDYNEFEIPKKGGTRTINYLDRQSSLWKLQRELLNKYLVKQDLPICVKGFKKGENYKSFLSEHIGAEFFLRIDIANFFPSIKISSVKRELSLIIRCDNDAEEEKLLDLIGEIVTLDGRLPQGASTSPVISNLVMARIDQRITKYCQVFNVQYTRYADDLLFSSSTFDFENKKWFLKKIKCILKSQELSLNYSKIRYGHKEIILNGYVISNNEIRLSRNRLFDIRQIVKFTKEIVPLIRSIGLDEFLSKANKLPLKHRNLKEYPFKSIFQFGQYLCGYRAYLISMVDTNCLQTSFQKELQRLIRKIEAQILLLEQALAIRNSN